MNCCFPWAQTMQKSNALRAGRPVLTGCTELSAAAKAAAAHPAAAVVAVGADTAAARRAAIISLAFPLVLAAGIFTVPFVSSYADHAAVEQAASQTARWFWGHIISGAAFGISVVAAHFLAGFLAERKLNRQAGAGMALISGGAVLLALGLGADGVGPVAVISGGGQASIFLTAAVSWFPGFLWQGQFFLESGSSARQRAW